MAHGTYRLTEIVGTSDTSVDEAIANGIAKASETIHNLDWFDVVSVRGALSEGKVAEMQVTLKVGFRVDD
jgi:flavin-binding protein dodecin